VTLSFAVMPIIRARYPDDWEAIALRIKHEAQWCCQHCQWPCRQPSEPLADFLERVQRWRQQQTPLPAKFEAAPRRYLLTVAHLDQQPSNQDPSNLKALCTVCHLQFDSRFRAKQALDWRSCDLGQFIDQSLAQSGIQVVHLLD
jgi:hypothetical protein